KEPQADDAARPAVVRAHGHIPAAGTDLHAGILLLVLEWIRRAVGAALVEPQPEALRIGTRGLLEARLVDQSEVFPSVVAAGLERGVRRQRLEEIEGAEADRVHLVPHAVVAARPHDPGVAAADLVGSERDAAVHLAEVVLVGGGKRRRGPARA